MARDSWSGRFGFILAAAGSAIGLGNLWKFPYITWNNDGGAFVLVYLVCIAIVGLPLMCSEILIGRRSQSSVASAFTKLGFKKWDFVGWLGVLSGFVILGFYSVIAGWSLSSFAECLNWSINGYEKPADGAFDAFVGNGGKQVGLAAVFSLVTALIVWRGISGGIERAAKILMPTLLVILVYILAMTMRLDGFGQAVGFLFKPNFADLEPHSVLEALGHAFFTLSLGMGAMITYGSYIKKDERIVPISVTVVVLDTVIALMACLIMYSIIFSFQMEQSVGKSTVGMLFVTLPELFYNNMADSGGAFIGPLFYVLVAFAAMSSTISLLEVIVSLFVDRFGWNRTKATLTGAGATFAVSILSGLSLGASGFLTNWKVFGQAEEGFLHKLNVLFIGENKAGVLVILDHVAANWLLPIGGLAITLFVGWVLPRKDSEGELFPQGSHWFYKPWLFFVRYIVPVAIGTIIVNVVFFGGDFS